LIFLKKIVIFANPANPHQLRMIKILRMIDWPPVGASGEPRTIFVPCGIEENRIWNRARQDYFNKFWPASDANQWTKWQDNRCVEVFTCKKVHRI